MSISTLFQPRSGPHASHSNVVTSVAFSPDGRILASGSWDGTIKLWDTRAGRLKLLRTLRGEWDEVEAVAFSPDGRTIAGLGTGFDDAPFGAVTLWSTEGGRGRPLVREDIKLDAIAFAPDGQTLATASGDRRSVTLRDVATGQVRASLPDYRCPIWALAYSPDGIRLAAACGKVPAAVEPTEGEQPGEIRLWDLSGPSPEPGAGLAGHGCGIISVAFSPDGSTLASGGFDRTAKLWDAASGREKVSLAGHEGWVASVAFSPDGSTLATGSHDLTIRLWDAATGMEMAVLKGHTGNVYSVAFSPDGSKLASGSLDGTVRVWELNGPEDRDAA